MPSVTEEIADIRSFLDAGEAMGISLPPHLREKLDRIEHASGGKLRVALVGAFSEGKTSLAAAWLGRLTPDMRIRQSESTNTVAIYDAGDGVELIDTPGLFGSGETTGGTGTIERFKDMTRKYVSQADLLLYVLNPSNPLKESHRAELLWLLRDLDLLPRTVFVIGRFDLIADMDEEEEFQQHLKVKRENVRSRLRDLVGLDDEEDASLSIVAVAANPHGKDIEDWLTRPAEHAKASRVSELRAVTASKLEAVGGADAVKRSTCLTIVSDVAQHLVAPARSAAADAERQAALADEKAREEGPRLNRYRRGAGEAQVALLRQVNDHITGLIIEAKNTDMAGFEEFFDRKIGRNGVTLGVKIKTAFIEELGPISHDLVDMGASFVAENEGGQLASKVFGRATDALKGGAKVTNKTVLKMRDWVMPSFKFAPHGAIKAAKFANKTLAGIGILAEGWTMLKDHQKKERFEDAREAIVNALQDQLDGIVAHINAPDFMATYFPQIAEMELLFATLASAFRDAAERNSRMRDWADQAEFLRDRFRLGSAPFYVDGPAEGVATVT